jgi:hypothetical protein
LLATTNQEKLQNQPQNLFFLKKMELKKQAVETSEARAKETEDDYA